jgi:hypothetical protein
MQGLSRLTYEPAFWRHEDMARGGHFEGDLPCRVEISIGSTN